MATIPSFAFHDVDTPHLADQMDVASSPFRQADDIDIDLDSVRDPSVIGSANEDMIDDDPGQVDDNDPGFIQHQPEAAVADDDMIDETNPEDYDFNMDGDAGEIHVDEDEDILYEEDEVDTTIQPEVDLAQNNIEAEIDLVDFEIDADAQPQPLQETVAPVQDEQLLPEDALVPSEEVVHEESEPIVPQDQNADHNQPKTESSVEQLPAQPSDGANRSDTVPHTFEGLESVLQEPEAVEAATNEHPPLHPVTLNYMDEEMSLFPPMMEDASAVYFLQDSTLAFTSLDKLLTACREILTGTLEHHDELVLDIGSLGLHICEDSKYASQLSLSQILDTYLLLCHNDGSQEIPPLYCYLSSRVSLASQYAYLLSSATEGKGFSEIAAESVDTPEPEESHDESAGAQSPEDSEQHAVTAEPYSDNVEHDDDIAKSPAAGEGPDPVADIAHDDAEADFAHPIESEAAATGQEPARVDEALEADQSVVVEEVPQESHDDPAIEGVHAENAAEPETGLQPESHEDETNSSHTLEAYPLEAEEDQVNGEEVDVEDLFDESYEHIDLEHDDPAPQDEEGVESFGDEELFTKGGEVDLVEDDLATNVNEPQPAVISLDDSDESAKVHDVVPTSHTPGPNSVGVSADPGLQPPQTTSPPITPSKNMHAKRKVDDDDELDLLDFDTPEPKRRRPS
ncbi:hypothetical protein RBB50_000778 [Rhinocladiella similis]